MQRVIAIAHGLRDAGVSLVGCRRNLGQQVVVIVIGIADCARLGVVGGEQAGKRIVGEDARAPRRLRRIALLVHLFQIVKRIVSIGSFVNEAAAGVGLPDI